MKSRLTVYAMAFVGLMLICEAPVTGQDDSNLNNIRTLWTKNPRIKPARFHILFMCSSSFGNSAIKATEGRMNEIFEVFNDDIRDFTIAQPQLAFVLRNDVPGLNIVGSKAELDARLASLEAVLRGADRRTDDVVFVYVLAHGVPNHITKQIEMTMGKETIDRESALVEPLRKLVQDKRLARLVVLITDTGAAEIGGPKPPGVFSGCGQPLLCLQDLQTDGEKPPNRSAMAGSVSGALMFGHEGFIDIQTADPAKKQLGFMTDSPLFLRAFDRALDVSSAADVLTLGELAQSDEAIKIQSIVQGTIDHRLVRQLRRYRFAGALDGNKDGLVSWEEFGEHLKREMAKEFDAVLKATGDAEMKRQGSQNIKMDLSKVKVRAAG
jgi:hypothetical protein